MKDEDLLRVYKLACTNSSINPDTRSQVAAHEKLTKGNLSKEEMLSDIEDVLSRRKAPLTEKMLNGIISRKAESAVAAIEGQIENIKFDILTDNINKKAPSLSGEEVTAFRKSVQGKMDQIKDLNSTARVINTSYAIDDHDLVNCVIREAVDFYKAEKNKQFNTTPPKTQEQIFKNVEESLNGFLDKLDKNTTNKNLDKQIIQQFKDPHTVSNLLQAVDTNVNNALIKAAKDKPSLDERDKKNVIISVTKKFAEDLNTTKDTGWKKAADVFKKVGLEKVANYFYKKNAKENAQEVAQKFDVKKHTTHSRENKVVHKKQEDGKSKSR